MKNEDLTVENRKPFEKRWLMLDYARERAFVREEFLLIIDRLAALGYNGLGLYLEASFAFRSFPGVIRPGVMTWEDAAFAVAECKKRGIALFPMTNVVGHMGQFFQQERFSSLLMADTNYQQLDFLNEAPAEEFAMQVAREFAAAFDTRLVHIGGDETQLTEENKMKYAEFLAKICKNLLDEGYQPAIWSDMLWMDPPLCEPFDRRTFIFDWNYYGHRPESIAFFKSLGFDDLIVCPSDNSWEGFINFQRNSPWLKAREDWPVEPDEVEAFLSDNEKAGNPTGFLTIWENHYGASLWAQWTVIARAGLYMSGKWEAGTRCDEAIETALFGRVTPYTEITYILQDEIQRFDKTSQWFVDMRATIFHHTRIPAMLKRITSWSPDFLKDVPPVLEKIEAKLEGWTPLGELERLAKLSLAAIVEMIRAASATTLALNCFRAYHQAALTQFEAPEAAGQTVIRIAGEFRKAAASVLAACRVFRAAITGTGHTRSDLIRMETCASVYADMADRLEAHAATIDTIPLVRFDKLLSSASQRTPLLPL